MTGDPVAATARVAAAKLSAEFGSGLAADVEAALHACDPGGAPDRYVDPVEFGSFLVSAASLAWQVYDGRRRKGTKPSAAVLAREVRVSQREHILLDGTQERIIEVVASEVIRSAGEDQ